MAPAPDRAPLDRPLPTLPAVVARLLALYSSEDYTAEQVTAVLETDPALASRVLRLANSAYYGFVGRVDTLQRSVVLLGEVTVQAVALGATLLRAWRGLRLPEAVEDVWVHSYLCGVGCRHAAGLLPPQVLRMDPDALFLAGLLHDVGKILYLAEAPEEYGQDLQESGAGVELREREIQRFGRDHATAGGDLLSAWNLPPWLAALVMHHHEGELRAELRVPMEALSSAHAAARGEDLPAGDTVTRALGAAVADRVARAKPEALEFYRAIS